MDHRVTLYCSSDMCTVYLQCLGKSTGWQQRFMFVFIFQLLEE